MHPTPAALQSQSVTICYERVKEGLRVSVHSGTCVVNNVMIPLFVRVWFQHVLLFCTVVEPFATASLPPYLCSLHALEIQVIPLACSGDVTRALLPATRMEKRPKGFTYSTLVLGESGVYRSFGFEQTVDLCAELLREFEAAGIRVIRMGLHASEEVEGEMLGGVYHPAFREIVESRLFLNDMKRELLTREKGNYMIYTDSRNISRAVGQKRGNIAALRELGYVVQIKPQDGAYIEVR